MCECKECRKPSDAVLINYVKDALKDFQRAMKYAEDHGLDVEIWEIKNPLDPPWSLYGPQRTIFNYTVAQKLAVTTAHRRYEITEPNPNSGSIIYDDHQSAPVKPRRFWSRWF